MIVCAAVVGQSNNPLYLKPFLVLPEEDALKFQYIVHCSLDAVEEKVTALRKATGEGTGDAYLGMLYPTEDYRVFGYITNTRMKFILVVDEPIPKDEEMRMIFKRFHAAYVDAISNPFYDANTAIHSQAFDASVRTIVTTI